MSALSLFGLFAVSAMLISYAIEHRGAYWVLLFAIACSLASIYGFLQGAWPFGLVEAVWAIVAARRWRSRMAKIGKGDGMRAWLGLVTAAAALTALGGCVQPVPVAGRVSVVEEVEVRAPRPPPPIRVEAIPAPNRPVEQVVWRPGHWHWNGREYVWIPGVYIERPRHEAVWVEGHWDAFGAEWVWRPGHWRS